MRGITMVPEPGTIAVGRIRISYLHRQGTGSTIVFVHGLGGAKENFRHAFGHAALGQNRLLSVDLVGFGDSDKPTDFSYRQRDQALVVAEAIERLGIRRFHVVCHSMGGIVGIYLAENLGDRIQSFVNAEGNLTMDDCFFTSRVARGDETSFCNGGFDEFKAEIEQQAGTDAALRGFLHTLGRTTAQAVYRSSADTVHECRLDALLARFCSLACAKCHVFGERNRGRFATERLLGATQVPVRFVAASGHAMMEDNPGEFYQLVANTVRGSDP
jgi:pimeloyl-ACP methyl ester carboxylesterase